jgi:Uma2 family endonuclease
MNVALQRAWTRESFLLWEAKQELRFEFDGFEPIAMAGGTAAHAAIQRNLITALTIGLRGKPCQPYGSELKIQVGEQSIRYPDAFVVCTPVGRSATVVTEPVVIFEILSDSSATTDFVTKNAEYQATPSVRRYVILEQSRAAAAVFSRDNGDWAATLLNSADVSLDMPEIGLTIPLADIYAGVGFEADT